MIRIRALSGALLALCVMAAALGPASASESALPPMDANAVTVSGISSGAAMAQQLHLAYADRFSGAGLIAGVPFGCAEGQLALALGRCMGKDGSALPVDDFVASLRSLAERGGAADPALLEGHRAWLFHGSLDAAVGKPAVDAARAVYEALLPAANVVTVTDVSAAHLFPTLDAGAPCDTSAPPWLGDCDFDAAGALLKHLFGDLQSPSDAERAMPADASLQKVTVPGAAAAGMAGEAYVFVPAACPETGCRLHLALHGCAMSSAQNGMAFIEQAGYLPWARANGIVVAFPEVVPQPVNPLGCWDWWGYTGANYLERDGAQMRVLADWVAALTAD